ncbi:MAG: M20/M25/M40 family metallo-hydrolase [Oscillospiraceae bacterium]|nr:M20/M25/M40 family metallo-hydrolase [Oscillospiraceae bacterium]
MNLNKSLSALSNVCGVSGDERAAVCTALEMLHNYTDSCRIVNGNVIADFGVRGQGKPHVLIDAHLDEIGLTVSYIDEDGFIIPSNIGGIDVRLLPAQKVIIHSRGGDIYAVVSTVPPHLSSSDPVLSDIGDVRIDTGYSREELEKLVSPGDTISFSSEYKNLLSSNVTGKSLDNRSSVAAVLKMLDILSDKYYECSFSVLFSCKEETGEQGAKTGCYNINPDIAIAVDVSFALTNDDSPEKCGRLGEGPMIGAAPTLSREVTQRLIDTAIKNNIPYQIEVMGGLSGTNADQFSISRNGVKTCTCSIPLRYMHTPTEVASLEDIENTAALLAAFISEV